MSKVSVIIPAFNCEAFIDEAVESVLQQTLQPDEIIVVDDGSTDSTAERLQKYRSVLRYIHQENKGPSAARNVGISNASGEYIAFLDNDDVWLPRKLAAQVDAMRRHPEVALVFSDAAWIRDDGTTARYTFDRRPGSASRSGNGLRSQIARLAENDGTILAGDWYGDLLQDNFIINSSVLMRREALLKVGAIDESLVLNSDYDLWLRISSHFPIAYLNLAALNYRVHEGSMSGALALREYRYRHWDTRLFEKHIEIGRPEFRTVIKKRVAQCHALAAWGYFHYGNLPEARRINRQALSSNWLNMKLWAYYLCLCMPDTVANSIRKAIHRSSPTPQARTQG